MSPGGAYREGWFYLWSSEELAAALGGAEGTQCKLFCSHYGVKAGGNCDLSPRSDPHREFAGRNVLRAVRSEAASGALLGLAPAEAAQLLADARHKLAVARSARPRPRLDDKVIAAWNGLAISAFARASRALAAFPAAAQPPRWPVDGCAPSAYGDAAEASARFVRDNLYGATQRLIL